MNNVLQAIKDGEFFDPATDCWLLLTALLNKSQTSKKKCSSPSVTESTSTWKVHVCEVHCVKRPTSYIPCAQSGWDPFG
jgi:hypothetical protein